MLAVGSSDTSSSGSDTSVAIGSSKSSSSTSSTSQPTKSEKPDLQVTSTTTKIEGYVNYIVGTVKNNTNKTYSYVQVEFNLYDGSGAQVGSTFDNINNLEPNGIWKFKAIITDDNAKNYKLKGVTGW